MKHLGDISKINGADIEPVDIITFGSPCQDLSVAGKRAGLRHEANGDEETTRSGLFMEAVRIIREMREATDGKYPKLCLWENVPGAFSSNKGEDFRVVLEELIKIAEPSATMPEVPPFGWAYADSYVGDGWSLAYRVFDTQYWPRTPQRRRRIYLVADFGGQRAREILFEREGLRGHLTESPAPRERVTAYVEVGSGAADREEPYSVGFDGYNGDLSEAVSATLGVNCGISTGRNGVVTLEPDTVNREENQVNIMNPWDSQGNHIADGTGNHNFPTLRGCGGAGYQAGYVLADVEMPEKAAWGLTTKGNGDAFLAKERHTALSTGGGQAGQGYPAALVYESHPQDSRVKECEDVSPTVAAKYAKGTADTPLVCVATQQGGAEISEDGICPTVTAAAGMSGNNQPWICTPTAYGISSYASNAMLSENPHSGFYEADTSRTLDLNGGNPACNQGGIAIVEPMAFAQNQRDEIRDLGDKAGCIQAEPGMKQQTFIVDSIGGQAERGWEGEIAPTLKASHYKFPPVISRTSGFCPEQGAKTRGVGWEEEKAPTLRAGVTPAVVSKTWDARGNGNGDTANTITGDHENRVTDYTSVVVEPAAQLASGADVSGCLMASGYDKLGAQEMFSGDYTVIETHPAEAITVHGEEISGTLLSRDYKGAGRWDSLDKVVCQQEVAGVDCRNMNEYPDLYPTLQAKPNGGQSLNFSGAVRDRYIVRRLTPTECARLQGFPDTWGHPDKKASLSDEEYAFWHEVRNTHAAITGKAVKEYTKDQMLKWYNKLHSDSAEYKMWGNGIALPPSLYCMQGIEEALIKEINEEEK